MPASPEDLDLIQRFLASREPALREEIILRYVSLVHYVLARLGMNRSLGQDYEDAVSQGLLGLIEAVDRYEADHGAQFSTYATLRIRGRVLDHLRSMDWLSRSARRRARLIQEATNRLWHEFGRAPSEDELAAHLELSPDELQKALVEASRVIVSLDTVIDPSSEDGASLHEMLADERQLDPADAAEEQDVHTRLLQALTSLSEREQMVLSMYYYEELTLKEVGAVLEVSESRVCQIHARAIINLRAAISRQAADPADVSDASEAAR
jgi:RNA polymerase sigma factor for flagellar operon FliA